MARGRITQIQRDGTAIAEFTDGSVKKGHIELIPGGGMKFQPQESWQESVDPLPEPPRAGRMVVEPSMPGA